MRDYEYKNAVLDGNYRCFFYDTPPPDVTLHEHDFDELLLCLSDEVSYSIADQTYSLSRWDLAIIPDHTLHKPVFRSKEPYRRVVLWIRRQYAKGLSTDLTDLCACFGTGGVIHLFSDEQSALLALTKALGTEESGYGADIAAHCALLELLVLVNRAAKRAETLPSYAEPAKFQHVIRFIEENYHRPLGLDTLAELCYLSKYHFTREFKREHGISPYQYIVKVRLARAKQLLPEGLSMPEIAYRCGFGDYSAFFKAFKRVYGVTPCQYLELVERQIV